MYAVVTTGGKQYRVEAGTELVVERVAGDAGAAITFDRVLLVGDGETVTVGTPTVAGASVSGTVLGEATGPKLIVYKFKQKVKYRRKTGHRQHLTRVRIDEISAGGKRSSRSDASTDAPPKRAAGKASAPTSEGKKVAGTKGSTRSATKRSASATPKADATDEPKPARGRAAKQTETGAEE